MVDGEEGGIEKEPVFLSWSAGRVAECLNKIKSLRRSCFERESSPGLAVFKRVTGPSSGFPRRENLALGITDHSCCQPHSFPWKLHSSGFLFFPHQCPPREISSSATLVEAVCSGRILPSVRPGNVPGGKRNPLG